MVKGITLENMPVIHASVKGGKMNKKKAAAKKERTEANKARKERQLKYCVIFGGMSAGLLFTSHIWFKWITEYLIK